MQEKPAGDHTPRPAPAIRPVALALVLVLATLALDLSMPLGVAGGVPYVAVVLLGWWMPGRRIIFYLALLGSALTAAGYVLSPPGGVAWIVLTNRLLALFAIWITAALLSIAKKADMALVESQHDLEGRVRLRTLALLDNTKKLEREVDGRKRAQRALTDAIEQATSANRAKSEFLANMSHELRTPLNAIIGFSELIQMQPYGPMGSSKYVGYIDDIRSSGRHLLDLVNDILDLAKVEAGEKQLDETCFDVRELVGSVRTLVEGQAEKNDVTLVFETPIALPALKADKRNLTQVFANLLSNAIKFTEAGGVVTLKAWCHANSGYIFQVIDTGVGIALEDIPRALTSFGQVDSSTKRNSEGTGLGLPLAKALTELHGGSLNIESRVGLGTTVTVQLPAERIAATVATVG